MSDCEMSPTLGELFAALAAAQGELEGAKKDSVNPHLKNKYADLASIVEASKRVLPKHGLCIAQTNRAHGKEGVCVVTTLGHRSGEWIRGELFLPATKSDAQGFGSAITYARRYGHAAIIGLAPEDDDGNAASLPPPQRGPLKASPTPPEQLGAKLGESVDMLAQAVELNERMARATTIGEVQAAWADVTALQKRGLPRSNVEALRALKDKRKGELAQSGSAAS